MIRRSRLIYGLLLGIWGVTVAWQVVEHRRVKESARTALLNRSRDISTTLGLVIRSQRRFGGMVFPERLDSALSELVKSGEVSSIALLNASGEVVASAGAPIDFETKGMMQTGGHWDHKTVTLVNPVDLGASVTQSGETNRPTIVLPRRDVAGGTHEDDRPRPRVDAITNGASVTNLVAGEPSPTNRMERSGLGRRGGGGPRFGRPFGMDEAEYKSLLEKRGLHGLAIGMSTAPYRQACAQDLWMRWIIACFAGISVAGLALAWRTVVKSSELQIRLLRASELNTHLKEMNLAAAGLAHETRNPLNIIRGLAQMISKQQEAPPEVRDKSTEIVNEADRVAGQLSEFINYSRPREVRRVPVTLGSVIGEVVRALNYDIQDKNIQLQIVEENLAVEADEQLLRQALFNLLLNAIQAVESNGEVQIVANRQGAAEASLEVRDNGPGVSPDHRADIFKPYFTTHQSGTGLGLAVVHQIVLAHGWEINCVANSPKGAIFRITHLRLATKPSGRAT